MKTKRTRRKYAADPQSMWKVMQRLEPFTADELIRLDLPIRLSFDALRNGRGTEQDFHDLCEAVNTAMIRGEAIDPLCEQVAITARDALARTWQRFERTGKLGFDGPALYELEACIDLHEQLLRVSTPGEMVDALRAIATRGRIEV